MEHSNNYYISKETWQVIGARASFRLDPDREHCRIRELGRRVQEILTRDRQKHAEAVGAVVNSMLKYNPPLIK